MDYLQNFFGQFSNQPIIDLANTSISIYEIIFILLSVVVFYLVYFGTRFFVNFQIKRNRIRSAQGKTLLQLFGYILVFGFIFSTAKILDFSLSYLLLGSTALLVGLGFGLQQLFLDLVSGVILLIDQNINLGDVVKVDIPAGKENLFGRIYHIGIRTTLLQTIDNEFMVIPNSRLLSSGVKSLMLDKGSARFRVRVTVAYDTDMELAKMILIESVLHDPKVDKKPEPTVIMKEFLDHGVVLEVRFYMKEIFYSEPILSDIRFRLLKNYKENNIVIPYPQSVVHNAKEREIVLEQV